MTIMANSKNNTNVDLVLSVVFFATLLTPVFMATLNLFSTGA